MRSSKPKFKIRCGQLADNVMLLGAEIRERSVDIYLLFIKINLSWGDKYSWEVTDRPTNVVVAGSYHEYMKWIVLTSKNPKDYRFICEVFHIVSMGKIPLNVYYVGRYDQNKLFNSKLLKTKNIVREVYEN